MIELPTAFNGISHLKQFVVYRAAARSDGSGKIDKFPVDINGFKLDYTNSLNWLDVNTALKNAKKMGQGHGLGFIITPPFWFLDIDNCLIDNDWSPLAKTLCDVFMGAAIEVSYSGKGLHILGRGNAQAHTKRRSDLGLEFYTENRFVALTGIYAAGDINIDCTSKIQWLIQNYFQERTEATIQPWTKEAQEGWNGPVSDEELIERATYKSSANAAFGGASFRDLWENNTEKLAQVYPAENKNNSFNASSADAALAQHLAFWTGNNCERMLSLMRKSSLVREKWNREKYLQDTILFACSKQKEFVVLKNKNIALSTSPTRTRTSTLLTVEEQKEYFKNCIYVRELHAALVPGGTLLKPEQFRVIYGGYSFTMDVNNERVIRNAWEAFTESQANRPLQADSTCFRPDLNPGEIIEEGGYLLVNTYHPLNKKYKKGDCTLILEHLKKLLPDERDRTVFLCYLAACVQYPGRKFQWAILIQGVEGNGKSLFSDLLQYAIGLRYVHTPKHSDLTSKFNGWMYEKLLIVVEDIFSKGYDDDFIEFLKPMITRRVFEIEQKMREKRTRNVCCNFILNTNYKDGLKKTKNNRIIAPFFTAQQSEEDLKRDGMDAKYFQKLMDWIHKEGGLEFFANYLQNYAIVDEFNPATICHRAPITTSTAESISHSFGTIEQEILEAVEEERIGFCGGWISSIQLSNLLDQLKLKNIISHSRRTELLKSLGYVRHPALTNGRVNNIITPDNGKPRLFILKDHESLKLQSAGDVARAYTAAQIKN